MTLIQESRYTTHALLSTKTLNSNQAWKSPNLEEGQNTGININKNPSHLELILEFWSTQPHKTN